MLPGHFVGVIEGDLKLVHDFTSGQTELFDLRTDPDEMHDLARERPGDVARLRSQADACRDPKGAVHEESEISTETRERLRSLGYAD
jgi:arylsulfatase A-like enzyme